jgi:hypothetical protein
MTDQERLKALDAACPGASADFIVHHVEAQTEVNIAQQEWFGIVFAENVELRGRVESLESQFAKIETTAFGRRAIRKSALWHGCPVLRERCDTFSQRRSSTGEILNLEPDDRNASSDEDDSAMSRLEEIRNPTVTT